MARRPRRRTVLLALLVAGVLWSIGVAFLLNDARAALTAGRDHLRGASTGATASSLLEPRTASSLEQADADFAKARSRLRSPILTPLRILPVAGRHLRAADRVVSTSQGATTLAAAAVADLHELSERSLTAGPDRIQVVRDLTRVVDRTRRGLKELDPGSSDALVGPLAEAVDELGTQRHDAIESLGRAEQATTALASVLEGPEPYLLLGANNGEMRVGSGMFLSAATLDIDRGHLELGDVRATSDLVLPAGSVPVTGDIAANWPWLDGGRDMRQIGLTADFPQSAPLAAANWAQVPGGAKVAGVIVVDVDALRGLLAVVGPVEVEGIRYTQDTVRGELLREQYNRFGDDQQARKDQIGAVAKEVFARIEAGDFELDKMVTALVDATQRRNLMVWSADDEIQDAWATTGADGRLHADSVSVALMNRGVNKLDSYLDTVASMASTTRSDGRVGVTIRYKVQNLAPADGPTYVVGPYLEGQKTGEYRGIVVVNLPAGTTDVKLSGARQTLEGTDGPTLVVAGALSLRRETSAEVMVTAVLPKGLESVTIEPTARIEPTRWSVDGEAFETDQRRTVGVGG